MPNKLLLKTIFTFFSFAICFKLLGQDDGLTTTVHGEVTEYISIKWVIITIIVFLVLWAISTRTPPEEKEEERPNRNYTRDED